MKGLALLAGLFVVVTGLQPRETMPGKPVKETPRVVSVVKLSYFSIGF